MCDSLLFIIAPNLKNIITWWDWPTFIILVFRVYCLSSLQSLMDLLHPTLIHHTPFRTTLVIIFILLFPLSVLVNSLLTSPGSFDQDPLIPIFLIHDFSDCVTGIISLVMGDDVIRDSIILDSGSRFYREGTSAYLTRRTILTKYGLKRSI